MKFIVEIKSQEDRDNLVSLINEIISSKKLSYPRISGFTDISDGMEMTIVFDKSDSGKVYRMLTTKGYVVK